MSQRCFLNSLPISLALLLGFSALPALAAGTATCSGLDTTTLTLDPLGALVPPSGSVEITIPAVRSASWVVTVVPNPAACNLETASFWGRRAGG